MDTSARGPNVRPCPALIWVSKRADGKIEAFCPCCDAIEVVIDGWEETVWAMGRAPGQLRAHHELRGPGPAASCEPP